MFARACPTFFLLSIVPLLGAVPAWRHAHPGGDRPHAHHDEHHDGASHAHLHVTLFGFELTLPVDSEDNQSQEDQATWLIADWSTVEQQGHSPAEFAVPALTICWCEEPRQLVTALRPKAPVTTFLCDTARHERSGVQLI